MKNKTKVIACFNVEQVINLLNNLLIKYVAGALLKDGGHYLDTSRSGNQPAVSFEVAHDGRNTITIRLKARCGPFGVDTKISERQYYSLSAITEEALTSHIMNALTWQGSPYYWGGEQFKKHMEVI